jgi:hypothetical protein
MLYNTSDAAFELHISPSRVRKLIRENKIKATKDIFGQWQITNDSLISFRDFQKNKKNKTVTNKKETKAKTSNRIHKGKYNRHIPPHLRDAFVHFICDITEGINNK